MRVNWRRAKGGKNRAPKWSEQELDKPGDVTLHCTSVRPLLPPVAHYPRLLTTSLRACPLAVYKYYFYYLLTGRVAWFMAGPWENFLSQIYFWVGNFATMGNILCSSGSVCSVWEKGVLGFSTDPDSHAVTTGQLVCRCLPW